MQTFFVFMRTILPYKLTYCQLLQDLHQAYRNARRHKGGKAYVRRFEARLEHNLAELCHELWTRTYKPRPSTCFIICDPKKREVFAADFRDRIVHHLYYNYTHQMLERTFIQDSYSCIKRRGTHYGIRRLEHHIRQESQNYKEDCYVMKMDIQGYFMHINRHRLLEICIRRLTRMSTHRVSKESVTTWREHVDIDFVLYLTGEIIMLDPITACRVKGRKADWQDLAHDKSLFNSEAGSGLPIGNLTSQLFSNVYLGELDDYIKRVLKCRHYGRYVDDFYVVSVDKEWLASLVNKVRTFLVTHLGLTLHAGKQRILDVRMGVEFLGAYLKPWRRYVSNTCLRRMKRKLHALDESVSDMSPLGCHETFLSVRPSLNSFLGVLSHYRSKALRTRLMCSMSHILCYGMFDNDFLRYIPLTDVGFIKRYERRKSVPHILVKFFISF